MAFTKKHGQWFPFAQHIQIHDSVLKKFETSMVSPTEYSLDYLNPPVNDILKHSVKFTFAHNGYEVKIEKKSKIKFIKSPVSGVLEPSEALTIFYNYVARNPSTGHRIRCCSPHHHTYDKDLPWHHKHHVHELTIKGVETVLIHDNDDRPIQDRNQFKFYVDNVTISITYLGQVDWHNVKDFLKKVSSLP
jgi:hypothetical protein